MTKNSGAQWGVLLAALITQVLAGCADLRLYSPPLDEQGKKAQKAWTDADLAGSRRGIGKFQPMAGGPGAPESDPQRPRRPS